VSDMRAPFHGRCAGTRISRNVIRWTPIVNDRALRCSCGGTVWGKSVSSIRMRSPAAHSCRLQCPGCGRRTKRELSISRERAILSAVKCFVLEQFDPIFEAPDLSWHDPGHPDYVVSVTVD